MVLIEEWLFFVLYLHTSVTESHSLLCSAPLCDSATGKLFFFLKKQQQLVSYLSRGLFFFMLLAQFCKYGVRTGTSLMK